jgi:NADPH-dependent 2,4-dienoyl-CoA reductase/sulfur reductase-like enzyme/pSer/pThr/pTyr-binding forkhead associated (FHA) protein/Fe-S-cluster-containing hydrogenase component 2/CRP-like cAMP-binding protein
MSTQQSYVVIGNGITGITAAEILRAEDPSCAITIIADDPLPVYYRPALKDYLSGRLPEEKLWARPATFYQEQRIRFIPASVIGINVTQHSVLLHTGKSVRYSKLLLATGARPATLSCPGLNLAGVSTLRTVTDYQQIVQDLHNVKRIVICGSGTLAIESAEILQNRGYQITHLIRGTTLWSEVLDPVASDMVLQEERRADVDVRIQEEIAEIVGKNGRVSHVVTKQGKHIPCEMLLIAIGIEPVTDFMRACGIACGRGVQVNNGMATNVVDIYAAGDVIETTDADTGQTRIVGQWFPSIQQAQIAAYNMLNRFPANHPFAAHSNHRHGSVSSNYYNATVLYGLDFVSIGLTTRPNLPKYREIVAPPLPRSYRKVIIKNGIIVGALLLGNRSQGLAFKRAIDHHVDIMAIMHRLFADDFHFDAWLTEQGVPMPLLETMQSDTDERASQKQAVIDISSQTSEAYKRNLLAGNFDAYFVPIQHPDVQIVLKETRLNTGDQAHSSTIGRESGSTVQIEHRSVSRLHAEILCSNGKYLLRDAGSSNGSFVNGSPLRPKSEHELRHQDQMRFGDVRFRFELRTHKAQNNDNNDTAAVPSAYAQFSHIQGTELHANVSQLIPDAILRSLTTAPTLVLVEQNTSPKVLILEYGRRYTLGRDDTNDIALTDPSLSRQHAEIFTATDGFYIRDLNSRYGVYVNSTKINNAYRLIHGDRIVSGNTLIYFSYVQENGPKQAVTGNLITPASNFKEAPITTKVSAINRLSPIPGTQEPTIVGLTHRREVQRLSADHIKFEINMCIGCNRCMDACPLPMSSQVNIANLNQATVSENIDAQIGRFTDECIMCGSCVPICPVDNHRDLLMLSLKQRLGVSWDTIPDKKHLSELIPVGWTMGAFLARIREQAVLRDPQQVPDNYLLHLILASKQQLLKPQEVVIREGEYGRDLYLILEGRLELTAMDVHNTELPIAVLRQGEYVGEDGMLTGYPYKATARAQTATVVLQVSEQVMQRLMELAPTVRNHFETRNSTRLLQSILKRIALFQGISDANIEILIRHTAIKQYERDEQLFTEDTSGRPARETLHILLEGFVKVARKTIIGTGRDKGDERIIAYRQGGDYFAGGLDLLGDGQAVTVTTINRCRVAEIPRQIIVSLFQKYPEVDQRFALRLREYLETNVATEGYAPSTAPLRHFTPTGKLAAPKTQAGLHSLVSDGVVEGTQVLVIDLDKCIHCAECEEACARRHGQSRMNRKGMIIGNITIATACRQCQDPVCMLCSRAGIARNANGEVYITESCIGCGICAERCPYGAISIVNSEDDQQAQPSWRRFNQLFGKSSSPKPKRTPKSLPVMNAQSLGANYAAPGPFDGPQARNGYDELRKKIAIKCDLCAGYKDQACVEACPTGAAIRIQPTSFFGSTEEILRRRAD